MIILFCLLLVISLVNCQDETLSRYEIETSINRTIEEVERMIKEDPRLPRLSRTEIVDILFNITSKDVESYADKENVDKAREEFQRALMVVLPYSPNASHDNLSDLYTKAPIVKMISDNNKTENIEMIYEDGKMEEIVYPEKSSQTHIELDSPSNNFVATESAEEDTEESTGSYENHRDTYSEVVDPIDLKKSPLGGSYHAIYKHDGKRGPERFSFNLNNLQVTPKIPFDPILPTSGSTSYTKPREEFEDSLSTDSKLEIVYSTTVNTKRPPTTKIDTQIRQGERTTFAPETTHRHVLTSDQWHYNAPPATMETPKRVYPEYKFHAHTSSPVITTEFEQVTEPTTTTTTTTTTKKPEVRVRTEGHNSEKKNGDKLYVDQMKKTNQVYVTPMSTISTNYAKNKFSSSYSANHGAGVKAGPTMPPMRSEVKELLASIGLSQSNPDEQPQVGSNVQIPGSNELMGAGQISGLESVGIESPSILSQNTFGNTNYDYKKGTQNLTPDMQLLLQTFGLQSSKQSDTPSITTKKPTPIVVNLNSYSNFKPIPKATVENEDMKDFLAKFGLGVNNEQDKNRGHKSIKTRKNAEVSPPSIIEAVPDNMKKILENMGLISRSEKSVEFKSSSSIFTNSNTTPKLHVFKPHETPGQTNEQKEKINKLLDTVRKVQSGDADSQDVQKAAKDLLDTAKTLQNGPDPISLEEILNIYNEGIKNEVKRQEEATTTAQPDSTTTTSLATETTTMPTTTSDTIPTESANSADLVDAFGADLTAGDPLLPGPRRTGLYFLVDWNTFLDVGEDGPDKVNLRFQPKVGDRTRFIPVTVP